MESRNSTYGDFLFRTHYGGSVGDVVTVNSFGNSSRVYNFDQGFTGAYGGDTYAAVGTDTSAFLLGLPSSAS